jgi:two-component system sensor histidine kinase ChiS
MDYRLKPVIFLFFIITFLFFNRIDLLHAADTSKQPPKAVKGVLDLSNWDFDTDGVVNCDGEWEFFWNQFIEPSVFVRNLHIIQCSYIDVPGSWKDHVVDGMKISFSGYATYHLLIKTKESESIKAIKFIDMNTAYKLWVNEKLIATNGVVGRTKKEMVPQWLPQVVFFSPSGDNIHIVIHVSNFHFERAGILTSLVFGGEKQVLRLREWRKTVELLIIGILLAMALFNMVLYFGGNKEKSMLLFCLLCITFIIRTMLMGERWMIELFPHFSWDAALKLEIATVFLILLLFTLFTDSLYPRDTHKIINILISAGASIGIIINSIIPTTIAHSVGELFLIILPFGCFYILFILIKASLRKRYGGIFLLTGYCIFLFSVGNDILYMLLIIKSTFLAPLGFIFFVITGYIRYVKYVRAEQELLAREKQLIQTDKLISLGTIASGIAHEVNNPNQSILMSSQTLKTDIACIFELLEENGITKDGEYLTGDYTLAELEKEIPETLSLIMRNSQRIKTIVEELRKYAREEPDALKEDVNINAVIESSIQLLHNQIKQRTHKLNVEYEKEIPLIKGHFQRLEQVIINLIQNACQALPDREKALFISTSYNKKNSKVIITIRDEGVGMDAEVMKKIYEPFFTTKRSAGGTGLGLSISLKIVKDLDGIMEFHSEPGKGTEVHVIFNGKENV